MVPLMNYSDVTYIVKRHERIAQLVAITTSDLIFDEVDSDAAIIGNNIPAASD